MAVQATFQSMGLRSEKAVSAYLLLENAHKSNLVSDISKVDYLPGNLGRHTCAPFPAFRLSSMTSMSSTTCAARTAWSIAGPLLHNQRGQLREEQRFVDIYRRPMALLAATYRRTSSTHLQPETTPKAVPSERQSPGLSSTPTKRRRRSGESCTRRQNWPVSLWQKLDVSEIPMDELQASLPAFEHLLLAYGYGLYCIDYTQDFLGVLDRGRSR